MERAPWQNPRVLSTLIFVFLTGAAVGALALRLTTAPTVRGGPYWKEGGREISLQRFKKELDLTPEQAKEMETVLDDFMMYYQTLQAQMDDVRATGKQRVLRILRDDQKQRFERMMADIQSKQLLR
jgi:hypothetical protein